MRMRPLSSSLRTLALCALAASCALAAEPGESASATPASAGVGVYPRSTNPQSAPRADEGWRAAGDHAADLMIDASLAPFLLGLPRTGAQVSVRPEAWPGPVRVSGVGDAGVLVAGDPVELSTLASDVRCPPAGGHLRATVGAEITEAGNGMRVQVRYLLPDPAVCEISALGRRRLQALAADLFLWARGAARAGTTLPARP